jgi:hypothetical protein
MTPAAATGTNRRRNSRHNFATELTFTATNGTGTALAGRGTTVDMSARGLLVELDREVEAGARVQLALAWPGTYHNCERVRLDITGQVVRVEGQRAAVRILTHEFRVPRANVRPIARTPQPAVRAHELALLRGSQPLRRVAGAAPRG